MTKLLFVGPVETASGYGTHARQLLRALVDSGRYDIYVESIRWGETSFLSGPEVDWVVPFVRKREGTGDQRYDISVQVTIPNEFSRRARFNVGVTAGIEVDRVSPTWLTKCNSEVDLVVVPSKHSYQTLVETAYRSQDGQTLQLRVPTVIVPEAFPPSFAEVSRREGASPLLDDLVGDRDTFLVVGLGLDKPLGQDRKNISQTILWFLQEFKGRDDVSLTLKVGLVNNSLLDFETIRRRIGELRSLAGGDPLPKIALVHGRLDERQLAGLYADTRVRALITLTHGEGFGLPILEAAAVGTPVIATDWSGHRDFLVVDEKRQFEPVSYDLTEVPKAMVWPGVIEEGSRWASVKEDSFKSRLRVAMDDPDTMEMRARRLRDFVLQNFSLEHVGNAFSQVVERAFSEFKAVRPEGREETVHALRMKYASANKTLLFTMPMSGGDVFLSTALLSHLRRRHPQARFFYATKPQYRNIVEGIEEIDEVIDWEPWMQDVGLLEDVFTDVYTPNLAIQMAWSNWVHRGQGRNLLEEMAVQCNIPKTEVAVPFVSNEEFKLPFDGPYMVIHTGSGKGQHGARRYNQWADVAEHISKVLMAAKDMWVVQVGLEDEPLLPGVVDLRGQTNYRQLYTVIAGARCVLSIDSISMHMAAAAKVPYVSLFGGSYADSTGPWRHMFGQRPGDGVLIETTDRLGCERACYKNECRVDPENPCINNINARDVVWNAVWYATGGDTTEADVAQMSYKRRVPKISGYTHVMDAKKHGYPFVQSIRSMLGFCSEVVVIDGGSTDGTLEDIAAIGDARVKVIHNTWDPEEPGMDGMQKALGRVMCDPTAEFLWQQDVDEVVHEDDYEKIIDVCRRFPADMLVLHLPVVELWGDDHTVRTDRHAWKWRLSRNDYRITHGIAKHAVVVDPKTHRIYAKKGMSDGCEYIDAMTREYIPHGGFWNAELDRIRVNDPGRYAEIMNDVFEKIPGVFHYSWADIPRKIRNFKGFWNTMWSRLYNDPSPVDRFPEVQTEDDVLRCAEALRSRGGEHGSAPTFTLRRQPPAVMDGWLKG